MGVGGGAIFEQGEAKLSQYISIFFFVPVCAIVFSELYF